MPKAIVDWLQCDGNGMCAAAAPELFSLDEEGSLTVLQEQFSESLRDKAEEAVASCPKRALRVSD